MPGARRITAPAAVTASLVVLSSCGSGEGLSKRDYIAQAEKVCTELRDGVAALPAATPGDDDSELSGKIDSLVRDAKQRLDALEPADDARPAADELARSARASEKLAEDLDGLTDEAAREKRVEAASEEEARGKVRLRAAGFRSCAE